MLQRVIKFLNIFQCNVRCSVQFWSVSVSHTDSSVILRNEDSKETLQFPIVWLRDNCQCASCFNSTLHSRIIPFKKFTSFIFPKFITCFETTPNKVGLHIRWPDNHESNFQLDWLQEHSFDENTQQKWLKNNCKFDKITWNSANFRKIIQYFSFDDLFSSEVQLLKWIITLNQQGIAILQGAGSDECQTKKLANLLGYAKRTSYGKLYKVENKVGTTNAAYLSSALQLHTDLPYYEYAPSVNLLHFVKQSPNENEGVNQLVDGLEICKQLKNFDLDMYNVLKNTLVEWVDIGKEANEIHHHIHRSPVICENIIGDIIRINLSIPQRDHHFCASIKQTNEWYKAMNWFINIAHHPKNLVDLKMKEGDILTFDNLRILHGRSAFTGNRTVIGTYMDWDVINSKMRILTSKLKTK